MKSSTGGPFDDRKSGILYSLETFAFVLVFGLLITVGGYDQSEDEPIYLTTMDEHHFVLPFMQTDQCMPLPGKPVVDSFGLHFRLPNGFLCPKPGLIICYRSQLDPSRTTNGLTAAKQYQVRNHPAQMDIVEKCRKEYPGERDIFHGIRISTNEKEEKIILELSITDHIFVLPLVDHFWINFGRENSLSSFVRLPDKEVGVIRIVRRYARDSIQYEGFMNNIGHGAKMEQFVGLWLLGMDILPMEFVKELHLFVFRDCNCTMEAWFTHPIYSVDPERLPLLNYGSNECQINNTVVEKLENIETMKKGDIITIWFSPIAETKFVAIRMKGYGQDTIFAMSIVISNEKIEFYEANWDYRIRVLPTHLPSEHGLLPPASNIRVEIHVHEYSFEVVYVQDDNENIVGNNNFWPTGGKKIEELKDVVISVHSNAFLGRIGKSQIEHQDWEPPKLPYSMRLSQDVTSGSSIRIHGVVEPNAKNIEINLMHDAPEWHQYIGATCLRIHVDFVSNTISLSTYHNKKLFENEPIKHQDLFKQGEAFDLIIVMERFTNETNPNITTLYYIAVNGHGMEYQGDLPVWTINWIWLKGDLNLLTLPIENYVEDKTKIVEKYELEHLFMVDDELCFSAKTDKAQNGEKNAFQIYLFHEANEEDENENIGDMLLKMEFTFDKEDGEAKSMGMNAKLHHLKTQNEQIPTFSDKNPLGYAGQDFSVVIKAERIKVFMDTDGKNQTVEVNQFNIVLNSGISYTFPEKPNVKMPPSWAVNWLIIAGNLTNVKIGKESGKCEGQKPLPPNIKQVDPKKPLAVGNLITIQGTIGKMGNFSISFFREAVEWHPIIGQTVMQANFTTDAVKFGTYFYPEWKGEKNDALANPLMEGDKFVMVVEVMKDHYKMQIGSKTFNYSHEYMPYWAVQYIVVNGNLEAKNDSTFIQIE